MKLFLIGDIHGFFTYLEAIVNRIHEFAPDSMIVQVGDFGYYPKLKSTWHKLKMPVHFIDGNHEYHPALKGIDKITEVWDGAFFIPRGTLLKLGEKEVLFCGGANSVDYKFRTLGEDYFLEEELSDNEVTKILEKVSHADLIVTHTPPLSCISANFDRDSLSHFQLPHSWFDTSSWNVDRLWKNVNGLDGQRPPIYSGHMHRSLTWDGATIIDINGIVELDL